MSGINQSKLLKVKVVTLLNSQSQYYAKIVDKDENKYLKRISPCQKFEGTM